MDLTVPVSSGLLLAAADSYQTYGEIVPQGGSIQLGVQQAVATAASGTVLKQVTSLGVNLPLDTEFAEPLVTAGLYTLLQNYLQGAPESLGRSFLVSAGSAYAARKALSTLGFTKNPQQSQPQPQPQASGAVVPAFTGHASRVIG